MNDGKGGSNGSRQGSGNLNAPTPLAAMKLLAASWYDETLSAAEKERILQLIRAAGDEE